VICPHVADQGVVTLVHDQVQGGVAKDGEPEESEYCRHQHHPDHKLADGAATADLGDEQAHERGPGDGPAEDEQGPVADPITARVGLQVEGALDDMVEVAAGILQEALEDVDAGPDTEDEQHQGYRQHHVEDRQTLDALVQTRHHGNDGEQGNDHDGDDLHGHIDRYAGPQIIDAGIDLGHRQPQGCGNAEHGAENGKHVDGVADGPVDPVADQRVQRRADG